MSCALDGSEPVELLQWIEEGVEISKWMNFMALTNETIMGIAQGSTDLEVLRIKKEKKDPGKELKILTLASLQADERLKQEIVVFNRNHEDCMIQLKEYYLPYINGATKEDALERLNADLLSGNSIDLLDMKSLSEIKSSRFYVKRGMLENLYDWMENDSAIQPELYTEEIWKANEVEGGLYSLIPSFSVCSMVGRTSQVGEGFSWTPEEMKKTLEKYKDLPLYALETKESFLKYMCQYSMDEFVNWEDGSCDFSNGDFAIFLEYAKSLPESVEENIDDLNELYFKRALLYDKVNIDATLANFLMVKQVFDEEVSLIGFPVSDGIGTVIEPGISLGICSQSSQKEQAWEAVRYFLSEDYQLDLINREQRHDLPVMESMRIRGYEKVMKDKEQAESGVGNDYGGWEIKFGYPTQEDFDEVEQLIQSTTKIRAMDQTIYTIIMEEASAYFSDQKELEEVVHLIQNRVSIYIKENE